MADVEITLTLPAELAEKAREAGLLTPERFADYLEREIERKKAAKEFFEIMDKLHALEPKLTEEEIETELAAAKAERIARAEAERKASG